MTFAEKRETVRKLEDDYLARIDALKAEYRARVQEIMKGIEKRRMEKLRKELAL